MAPGLFHHLDSNGRSLNKESIAIWVMKTKKGIAITNALVIRMMRGSMNICTIAQRRR